MIMVRDQKISEYLLYGTTLLFAKHGFCGAEIYQTFIRTFVAMNCNRSNQRAALGKSQFSRVYNLVFFTTLY